MKSSESSTPQKESKSKNTHPRRFSDEQIKSLESIFKQETKLEPRKKLQIARDLCLQPKQVAIWFQNKRARWNSKQLEQEFKLLKSNYDALLIKVDDLKREKHSLQMQLQELNDRCCSSKNDDEVMASGDDERIITSCFGNTIKDHEFIRWNNGEEEEMRNLSLFDENIKWWES